jgi:hypothetical protein
MFIIQNRNLILYNIDLVVMKEVTIIDKCFYQVLANLAIIFTILKVMHLSVSLALHHIW